MIQEAIKRIQQMELCFDALGEAAKTHPNTLPEDLLGVLTEYYESGQWLRDYELDEAGLLPRDLKRGVLAQDAVYDFLEQLRQFRQD